MTRIHFKFEFNERFKSQRKTFNFSILVCFLFNSKQLKWFFDFWSTPVTDGDKHFKQIISIFNELNFPVKNILG